MKTFGIALVALLVSTQALADTLTVEFRGCTNNPDGICALVYGQYQGQEMPISAPDEIVPLIQASISPYTGSSLAMNISGKVVNVDQVWGGGYLRLQVNSLNDSSGDSKPRGF